MKQIGKVLRQINQEKPVKLMLQRLASKQSLGFLLSGLKGNRLVYELNLEDCQLDDEDLEKIKEKLIEESGINTLKLGKNQFDSVLPLIDLLAAKGHQYRSLDISGCPVTPEALRKGLVKALSKMGGLEEFTMAGCMLGPNPNETKQSIDSLTKQFINSILHSKTVLR